MKIKLSKKQWEEMGKKGGWMRTAAEPVAPAPVATPAPASPAATTPAAGTTAAPAPAPVAGTPAPAGQQPAETSSTLYQKFLESIKVSTAPNSEVTAQQAEQISQKLDELKKKDPSFDILNEALPVKVGAKWIMS